MPSTRKARLRATPSTTVMAPPRVAPPSTALEPATLSHQAFDTLWHEEITVRRQVIADAGVTLH
ncbi:hypothetical protein ACKI2N_023595 [Cupriavidus sp. 30B13]|uniref:hypothetical protein n=1 Tax=Cupriavidus sp. 30B13 TaxID=3384241 RepID=UPI003B905445